MKKKNNKPNHCVFVRHEFATMFPNFDSHYRKNRTDEDIIFDCLSVADIGNYLDIVAIDQKIPDLLPNLHIWIPTAFVQSVLFDSKDKVQMGFVQKPQDGNGLDQFDQSP